MGKISEHKKIAAALTLALFINAAAMPVAAAEDIKWNNTDIIDESYDPFAEEETKPEAPLTMKERVKKLQEEQKQGKEKSAIEGVAKGHIYIPKGTKLKVALVKEATSKKMKKNELVELKLVENLIINGVVVIPKDTMGTGYVYEVQKAAAFGRKGVLRIAGKDIKTLNNITVPLRQGLQGKGSTDGGAVAVAAAVSLAGGFFMKGSNMTYPAGTEFYVEVRNNVDLNVTPQELEAAMNPEIPHGVELEIKV